MYTYITMQLTECAQRQCKGIYTYTASLNARTRRYRMSVRLPTCNRWVLVYVRQNEKKGERRIDHICTPV